uniref:Uncharacterized protein n=1 Tax=Prolemur simus TaxID=1328070 RepID=A0A8C8YKS8_PROSS
MPGQSPPVIQGSSSRPTPVLAPQALYLLFLGSPRCAPALPSCKEEEYPVGSECCPKCSPAHGHRVRALPPRGPTPPTTTA